MVPPSIPTPPDPERVPSVPFVEGGPFPSFLRHFDMRFATGAIPWSGADQAGFGGWCRHRTTATGPEALLGLIDAWPPPVLALLPRPTPSSSVTWSAHLLETELSEPDGFYWFRAEAVDAARGYSGLRGWLHASDGRLVAHADQLVAVFG